MKYQNSPMDRIRNPSNSLILITYHLVLIIYKLQLIPSGEIVDILSNSMASPQTPVVDVNGHVANPVDNAVMPEIIPSIAQVLCTNNVNNSNMENEPTPTQMDSAQLMETWKEATHLNEEQLKDMENNIMQDSPSI